MAGVPFTPTWPEELRSALVTAILERGMTAVRALELAAAGRLVPGMPPASPPIGTVRDWARLARRERRAVSVASDGPAALLAGHAGRLSAILDRETLRLERAAKPVDPRRIAELARAGVELAKLQRAIAPDHLGAAPAQAGGPDAPAGFLAELASENP